ncbi:MAG: DNRLRE domain-containing protein, partial [Anaerolineae bacterium]|nr:DNRLRE domain-containing protein [Thermoflexales bacterium]MDW8408747.1 DNRLRE domain-containing protein [Anaerolineae bacterium]
MTRLGALVTATLIAGAVLQPDAHVVFAQSSRPRRVNAPQFTSAPTWSRSAIFWFGQNQQGLPSRNYADVRVGYTGTNLHLRVTVVDYALWYPASPSAATDLTQYDAVAVYLDTGYDRSTSPQTDDYWFLSAYRWDSGGNNPLYQRRARGTGAGWDTSWSGAWSDATNGDWNCDPGPNNNACGIDNGWTAFFNIPFASIGPPAPPPTGTVIGFGVVLYDRDDQPPAGAVVPQTWPETFNANSPATWGELRFGEPTYRPPPAIPSGAATIRAASPIDNTVEDAWMGGGGDCSGGQFGGGEINHGTDPRLFVGTEVRAVHFPCFNKSFLRFQLSAIPPGKVIISAALTLHLWGGADPSRAQRSWVHLFVVNDPWDEMTIHW